jgi:hypothetical protein
MISFDLLSLFTMMLIKETVSLLSKHFEEDIMGLFRLALKVSCICFAAKTYGKILGIAICLLLYLVSPISSFTIGAVGARPGFP